MPGNAARKNEEIANYLQNYEMYNLVDKADLGFVDTMKHLISSGNLLFLHSHLCWPSWYFCV